MSRHGAASLITLLIQANSGCTASVRRSLATLVLTISQSAAGDSNGGFSSVTTSYRGASDDDGRQ